MSLFCQWAMGFSVLFLSISSICDGFVIRNLRKRIEKLEKWNTHI